MCYCLVGFCEVFDDKLKSNFLQDLIILSLIKIAVIREAKCSIILE